METDWLEAEDLDDGDELELDDALDRDVEDDVEALLADEAELTDVDDDVELELDDGLELLELLWLVVENSRLDIDESLKPCDERVDDELELLKTEVEELELERLETDVLELVESDVVELLELWLDAELAVETDCDDALLFELGEEDDELLSDD